MEAKMSKSWCIVCVREETTWRWAPGVTNARLIPSDFRCRLVHQGDCLDKRLYPLLTHKNRAVTQKCAVCHVFIGRCVNMQPKSGSPWIASNVVLLFILLDGTPSATSLLPVIHVSSVTNASGCFIMMSRASNWESSWLIHTWTAGPLTELPVMLYYSYIS